MTKLLKRSEDVKMVSSSKVKRVTERLGRLALTGIVTCSIGAVALFERYNNYWDKTIFRVQTVDFNILSHTLPTKLSYAIIQNKPEELQRTLNSNYSLFGLVVTDPTGQKIIASSQSSFSPRSWAVAVNSQRLQKYPYDLLLDPPPLYPQWSYSDPHAVERSATNFTNRGRVIGKVYYVRGVKPTFKDDFFKWLSNPIARSSRIEIYTITMLACLTGGLAFWLLWEHLLYKKWTQKLQHEEKEKELVNDNETLSLQLSERINESKKLKHEIELERANLVNQAEQFRNYNQQLKQEISQLHETIAALTPVTSLHSTQAELDKAQQEIELANSRQQEQEQQIQRLNQQLEDYQNQLLKAQQKGVSLKQLQNQIKKTEKDLSSAEEKLQEIRSSENILKEKTNVLEQQLAERQAIQNQLTRQLENLQEALVKSQQQEQESCEKAEKASQQLELLTQELELLNEETGKRPLNSFENTVLSELESKLINKKIYPHFDANNGGNNSKFMDFLVVVDNYIIVIEAKSYTGVIESADPRNKHWNCQKGSNNILVKACWGVNPYQQVKAYADTIVNRTKKGSKIPTSKVPVYGIVVFPSEATVARSIRDNMGQYYRVTTLNNLIRTINEIQNQVKSKNLSNMTYQQIVATIAA